MMKIDGKFRSLEESQEAFNAIRDEFIEPYNRYLRILGQGGVKQGWNGGTISYFAFPSSYNSISKRDVSAVQHEMGHFITVPEVRCIRTGFGFGGGIPVLSHSNPYGPDNRMMLGNMSATTEAKAMAWEVILSRDIHGIELDHVDIARSLTFTDDYLNYEGKTDKEKIQWAADKITRFVNEFGTADDFRKLWHERCAKLPELFRREQVRSSIHEHEPVSVSDLVEINDEWHGFVEHRSREGVDLFSVTIKKKEPEDWEELEGIYEDFDTSIQANRWLSRVKSENPTVLHVENDEPPAFGM